eukprot:TRINITY_DN71015_c0_g1_i1.p1 TRINITY_DN71015_c0_g1~~TRINITY_DN71015_c0_g1_i1.p1  ORF type:complete len:100 (+),score=15.90 TRINITY_DN71015_c0_g1_i1:165-464(+)
MRILKELLLRENNLLLLRENPLPLRDKLLPREELLARELLETAFSCVQLKFPFDLGVRCFKDAYMLFGIMTDSSGRESNSRKGEQEQESDVIHCGRSDE